MGDPKDGIQTKEYKEKNLTVWQMHERTSLKEAEGKVTDPSNSGNEWNFQD